MRILSKLYLTILPVIFACMAHAQVPQPELLWMRSIGCSASESISSWVLSTPDGGFITRIESTSPAGTGNIDSFCSPVERRMIFTKFNNDATVAEWSKCFGTQGDSFLLFLYPQPDGSDIVLGDFKASGALIKKYDAAGGEVWQKNYSKGKAVKLHSTMPTADGGYLLLCTSHYVDTNVLVHYGPWDLGDFWLVKVDSSGNKVWSKVIGGTHDEDLGVLVRGTGSDFYIIGVTGSIDLDCAGNHGKADVFVARCNDTGGIIWRRLFGGSDNDVNGTACSNGAGGLIIAGYTSSADGDVHHFLGGEDYWVLEVDTGGNILWENCYGTTGYENATSVCKASDGTIWVNGQTFTPDRDVFLVHTNNIGDVLHQRIMKSTYEDEGQMVFPLSGGKTLAGGYSVNLNDDFAAIPYRGSRDVFLAVFAPWDAGIGDMATKELYSIFPNPTRGELTIETKETGVSHQVMLTDVIGRVVLRGFIQKGTDNFTIQTGSLLPGAYTLSIIPNVGDTYRKVIVIQQ